MSDVTMRGAPPPAPLDSVGGRVVLMMLLLILGLAGAGIGGAYLIKVGTHRGARATGTAAATGNYAPLPTMVFTLNDGDRLRDVRLRVVLDMDPSVPPEEVTPYAPRIANTVSEAMLEVDPATLRGSAGLEVVKETVAKIAGRELRPMRIRTVLVQDLLIR